MCNPDGTLSRYTFRDAHCATPEVDDATVTTNLLQAMLQVHVPAPPSPAPSPL